MVQVHKISSDILYTKTNVRPLLDKIRKNGYIK